eukprot:CAMPEP_0169132322 /NCGR_PEP_ID=MMETSP1015-20121227/38724_1 /TAXON_ID=342587 /ORGANISM="Karlodinium micrum, Strain CCMP2283" /LENGTH=143 /DNA_ID=CAMNT_0009196653 /DNA_START=49 /DNA_END=480 /DNA_ORIENTATION=-
MKVLVLPLAVIACAHGAVLNAADHAKLASTFLRAEPPASISTAPKGTQASDPTALHATAKKDEKLLPIGEGAYQDSKAVMQRTVDKNLHCEEGKWHDCYKDKGDYLDGHSYGNHKTAAFDRSGANAVSSTACLLLAVAFVAMQ